MQADERNKETRLTISQPLQVQDTLLAPGQYVFELIGPGIVSTLTSAVTRRRGLSSGGTRTG
jgi:hypothetical protein